uniref:N-acetyltransferase domain-containing protein n=1 Tax=Bosea sp. NBC_00436 TaxID=2969620 RepID=A0A9E8A198_9HYPH
MMESPLARTKLIGDLEREPLRNVVLLKQLAAFPKYTTGYRATDHAGATAHLVVLDAQASSYDREAYPTAASVALISSNDAAMTARVISVLSRDRGIVFKLASAVDHKVVASCFPVERKAAFHSFTAGSEFERDEDVHTGNDPSDMAISLLQGQGHPRDWLLPLLQSDKAFVCNINVGGALASVCITFESYGRVWEVGGVVTPEAFRGRGLAGRVVRTALAVLSERALIPRYQVNGDNHASLSVARKTGLQHFLTLEHYLYNPSQH